MNLSSLYSNTQQAQFLHSQYYIEGVLTGAAACPEIPLPDVWLPWAIKEHNQIQSIAQADEITNTLFAFFKDVLHQMHVGSLHLPDYASFTPASLVVLKDHEDEPLSQWCKGILMAHAAREQYWQGAWDKMQSKSPEKAPTLATNLKHCLGMFTTFADPIKAIQSSNNPEKLRNSLPTIANSLEDALLKYVAISGDLASYLPNQFETFKSDNLNPECK